MNDEDITVTGCVFRSSTERSFLQGWNVTTDMYRLLEYLVDQARSRKLHARASTFSPSSQPSNNIREMFHLAGPSTEEMRRLVDRMHQQLPNEFKFVQAMTGDPDRDRFGFQGEPKTAFSAVI